MYLNTGYLNRSLVDFKDKSRPLIVGSCGNYRLSSHPKMPTNRPRGRLDYQIIYISSGLGHFHFGTVENETIISAGNFVLFRPKELQKYEYYGKDKTEVYWVHFTGSNVKNILKRYGFPDNQRVFHVGTSLEYKQIFLKLITELQQCQSNYEEMLAFLLHSLLIIFSRDIKKDRVLTNEFIDSQMNAAVSYFNSNYNQSISISQYAASKGMSISYFISNFKKYTQKTPVQFLSDLRLTNAQVLLETTDYSINEIARIVGYDNALYFSRLFHNQKGCSPSQYRNQSKLHNNNNN